MVNKKLKVPKGTSDVKFYDKDKYTKLILSPYEFKVGDMVVNRNGELYTILKDMGEKYRVNFIEDNIYQTFCKHTHNCKRVVLRPKFIPEKVKPELTPKERKRAFINQLCLLLSIFFGAIYTDIFIKAGLGVTSSIMGGLVSIWFLLYVGKLLEK